MLKMYDPSHKGAVVWGRPGIGTEAQSPIITLTVVSTYSHMKKQDAQSKELRHELEPIHKQHSGRETLRCVQEAEIPVFQH
jgi:replication-associated recombination protein RarA